jgi:hypothetical protein
MNKKLEVIAREEMLRHIESKKASFIGKDGQDYAVYMLRQSLHFPQSV